MNEIINVKVERIDNVLVTTSNRVLDKKLGEIKKLKKGLDF